MPFISTISRKFAFGRNSAYYKSLKLEHTLDNPDAYVSAGDRFGESVAISGNYAIVGVPGEDEAGGISSGKVYIFNVTGGSLVHTLDNPNAYDASEGDRFGDSVAMSGNYAIVGAASEDDASGSSSGKAYIFDVTSGSLLHTLDNPNAFGTSAGDGFGESVAISGDRAIVGARYEDDAGGTSSGKAYIFNVTDGSLVHTLNNPNAYSTSANDAFGNSVAISGNYAIVGVYGEDDAGGTTSGKAYIFDVSSGSLLYTLNNPNAYSASAGDQFGRSVAIDGNYAIIGAHLEDSATGTDSGKAYIYDISTFTTSAISSANYVLENPNAYSSAGFDEFGEKVAISGNYVIVGAVAEDDAGGTTSGKAYIYDISTFATSTILSANYVLDNPSPYGTSAGDAFGWPVAISGNRAIVSARLEDDLSGGNSGKAYIYKLSDSIQYQPINLYALYNPNAFGTSAGDTFGDSVAIDGNYAIVGAWIETDENVGAGFGAGKAYIFDVTTGSLVHTLDNPNAYSTSANDYFGIRAAISGNRAIVGAYAEDDAGGTSSGKAYIFDVSSGNLLYTLDNPNAYDTSQSDVFATSVAIDGDYVIVGARSEDDAGGTDSGKAYIYDISTFTTPTISSATYVLDNPNAYGTSADDEFGVSVAISGDRAIVGARSEDSATGSSDGKAYIFDVTTGSLVHTLDNPNAYTPLGGDEFGYSVAISGNYAIVGSNEGDAGGGSSGKAYIFDVTSGSLLHTLDNPNAFGTSQNDYFSQEVAISGNYAIVGAYGEDDADGTNSGKAYIFDVVSGNLLYTLDNPNVFGTSANDNFGRAVAISGNRAIVGAQAEDDAGGDGSGAAYVFKLP